MAESDRRGAPGAGAPVPEAGAPGQGGGATAGPPTGLAPGSAQVAAFIGALGDDAPSIHPDAWIAPGAVVVGRVTIGRGSSVWYGAVLRADDDEIVVGAECNIQDQCCLHVDPQEPVVLGDRVTLGHRAIVHGAHVEAGALIGIGAIVLGGCRIGSGSLVAAGAVVTPGTRVPEGVLVTGIPARVRRELTARDVESFAATPARYAAKAQRHRFAAWLASSRGHGPAEWPGRL